MIKNVSLVIEQNVAIPAPVPQVTKSPVRATAEAMAVGDSVMCPNFKVANNLACNINRIHGKRSATVRAQNGGFYRVWRIDNNVKE